MDTMTPVTAKNSSEFGHMKFCIAASDLQLPPGVVPTWIPTTLGNGQDFVLASREYEPSFWIYRQALGCIELHLLND